MSRFFYSGARVFSRIPKSSNGFHFFKRFPSTLNRAIGLTTAVAAGTVFLTAETKNKEQIPWDAVRADIEELIESNSSYDDGSFGPLLVRLAWHCAGTFSCFENNGGSYGATMRFDPERSDPANAGLGVARDLLAPLIAKYPGLSHGDLWTLAGAVAIEFMGGPAIPWYPGRQDLDDDYYQPPRGRLPAADRGCPAANAQHLRNIFDRQGFDAAELVALSGAHALGRCHDDRSGYVGPWTFSPTTFSNEYFKLLLSEEWVVGRPDSKDGDAPPVPLQYTDKKTRSLMMLPSDLALVQDPSFFQWVKRFAGNERAFNDAFAKAFGKMLANGVPAPPAN